MISLEYLRKNTEKAKAIFKKRGCDVDVDEFLELNGNLNLKKSEFDKMKFDQKRASIEEAKRLK